MFLVPMKKLSEKNTDFTVSAILCLYTEQWGVYMSKKNFKIVISIFIFLIFSVLSFSENINMNPKRSQDYSSLYTEAMSSVYSTPETVSLSNNFAITNY